MIALLDMPAMTFTALALLLFLDERIAACAAACTVLVLMKETAITTPIVFGAWLLAPREAYPRSAVFSRARDCAGRLAGRLHHATGHWLGNDDFARYNVSDSLNPGTSPERWRGESIFCSSPTACGSGRSRCSLVRAYCAA